EATVRGILQTHKIDHELKWNGIRSFRPDIEASIAAISFLLDAGAIFRAIVVEKATYEKWKGNQEEAFYKTYTFLVSHIVQTVKAPFDLYIDERSDKYSKRLEVMGIISNHTIH